MNQDGGQICVKKKYVFLDLVFILRIIKGTYVKGSSYHSHMNKHLSHLQFISIC